MIELAIRDLKEGAGREHIPSGHFHANAAWLGCSVLAHNIGIWTSSLAGQPTVTNRTLTHTTDRIGGGHREPFWPASAPVPDRMALGQASSSRCSNRSGRSPHPLRAETDTRGLTHPAKPSVDKLPATSTPASTRPDHRPSQYARHRTIPDRRRPDLQKPIGGLRLRDATEPHPRQQIRWADCVVPAQCVP